MSKQYPGGLITKTPVVPSGPYETSTASGIWTLDQQAAYAKLGQWPTAGNPAPDAQFNYVTMLLHGDGTNGAQNNTFLDSSSNTFSITRNGNTTQGSFSPYGSNWSNYFPGATNLFLATATALGTGNVTVEFWFYPNDTSVAYYGLYDGRTAANTNTGLGIFQYGQTIEIYGNGLKVSTAASAFTVNTWTHFAVVRTSGTCQIYINGVASGSSASYADNFTSTTRTIASNVTTANVYAGYISNLREVTSALYSGTFTPSTTPLTAISGTTLLTCQSNRFIDNSANSYAITTSIALPTVQRFNPFGTATAYDTSVIGGSAYFDASTSTYLTAPSSSNFTFTGDFTVECWLYVPSISQIIQRIFSSNAGPNGACFFSVGNNTGTNHGAGRLCANGQLAYPYSAGLITSTSAIPTNTWIHAALVRSGSTVTIYQNGVSVASGTNSSTWDFNNSAGVRISGTPWDANEYLNGYISNLRVTNTAVYTSAFTPNTAPLTAISGTVLLLSTTNGAIFDNAMMNNLQTVGNAQISTSVVKYGTGSISNVASASLFLSQEQSFGTGDFTWEAWIYPTAYGSGTGSNQSCIFADVVGVGTSNVQFNLSSTGTFIYYNGVSSIITTTATATLNAWSHVALVRSSGTSTIYLNGTSIGSASDSANIYLNSIGGFNPYSANNSFRGYLDEVRVTKGYARYTATFTPPTAAFPNIGPT